MLRFFFAVQVPSVKAATITWDGSDSTSWSLGANWVGNVAPIATDDVVINGDAIVHAICYLYMTDAKVLFIPRIYRNAG